MFDVNKERDDEGNCLVHRAVQGGKSKFIIALFCYTHTGLSCLPHLFYLVKSCNADITLFNEEGLTPACLAAKRGDEKMEELLICVFGAGVNSTDVTSSKWSLLHFAARYNHPALIRCIL